MIDKPLRPDRIRYWLKAYFFIVPSLLFVLIFLYYPMLTSIYHSFTDWNLAQAKWIGLDNYIRMFNDNTFRIALSNQLLFTITDIVKSVVFPLLAAELILSLRGTKLQYLFRTGFVIPMLIPGIVFVLIWLSVYNPSNGLLNHFLSFAGLNSLARPWLGESDTAIWAVILMGFPYITGLPFLIFLAAIAGFNKEIIESARMDGAKFRNIFLKIHLPLLAPQFKVVLLLTIIGSLQDFVRIIVLTGGGPGVSTTVPSLIMYNSAFKNSNYGYGSAVGIFLFVSILLLTLLVSKIFKSERE